jgi:acetyl/propionyl-CoA carboxylase alpha subunit
MSLEIAVGDGAPRPVDVARHGEEATVFIDGRFHHCSLHLAGDAYELRCDDRTERVWIAVQGDLVFVHAFGRAWELTVVDPVERARAAADQADLATAPMPGTVVKVAVEAGDQVSSGQPLVVIESMKMQSEIIATRDGVVDRVFLDVGENFDRGAALVALAPEDED